MWIVMIIILILIALSFQSGPARLEGSTPASINTLEQIELNGVPQWISIRGMGGNKPVLLFLHGGPGSANLALVRKQMPQLEKHFVVVNWDQRGAGKSIQIFPQQPLSAAQLHADTHALVEYLKTRFEVEKIYLAGFSWGSVLGLTYAAQHPENLHAYFGISQFVNGLEGERISLDKMRQQAEAQDPKALAELAEINPENYASPQGFSQLKTQRKWLLRFGNVYHTRDTYSHEAWMLFTAPEYSLVDFALWPYGSSQSLKRVYPEVMQINFKETIPSVQIPVVFLSGRYDYNTPQQLVADYFEQIDAPAGKSQVWFEDSAHAIIWDEPEKLAQAIVELAESCSTD